jgi:hypothetical protein
MGANYRHSQMVAHDIKRNYITQRSTWQRRAGQAASIAADLKRSEENYIGVVLDFLWVCELEAIHNPRWECVILPPNLILTRANKGAAPDCAARQSMAVYHALRMT